MTLLQRAPRGRGPHRRPARPRGDGGAGRGEDAGPPPGRDRRPGARVRRGDGARVQAMRARSRHSRKGSIAGKRAGALEIEILEQSADHLDFNVTRCRYAEMYRPVAGRIWRSSLSCCRDFALIEGFNPGVILTPRTRPSWKGPLTCDFRFRLARRTGVICRPMEFRRRIDRRTPRSSSQDSRGRSCRSSRNERTCAESGRRIRPASPSQTQTRPDRVTLQEGLPA